MKRFILTSVAVTFAAALAFTSNLDAAPHKGGGGHAVAHAHASVAVHHPAAHAHAPAVVHHAAYHHIPFHVHGYAGWASRCWLPGYRCYGYYSGQEQIWYYWYAPFNEYLPISYMSMYPPTPYGVAPVGVVPLPAGSPALPPGATFVPGPITAP